MLSLGFYDGLFVGAMLFLLFAIYFLPSRVFERETFLKWGDWMAIVLLFVGMVGIFSDLLDSEKNLKPIFPLFLGAGLLFLLIVKAHERIQRSQIFTKKSKKIHEEVYDD